MVSLSIYLSPGAQDGYKLSCSIISVIIIADTKSPVHVPHAAAYEHYL